MVRPRLLDLTRSLRRAGRVATGIDRVEQAYLARFLVEDVPVYGLCRTPLGYVLLDRIGLVAFQTRLEGHEPWGSSDMVARLSRTRYEVAERAQSDIRRWAIARAIPMRLPQMLNAQLGVDFDYFNVGHSNLTQRVLAAVRDTGGTIHVLVHDVIPLEMPAFQRPGTIKPFEQKMRRVSANADVVIYTSQDSRQRVERVFEDWGRVPFARIAPLGVSQVKPNAHGLPTGLPPKTPYFVCVGTIEPRKNHAFLLDLWDRWGSTAPTLIICGARGWNNVSVFERLDTLDDSAPIIEVSGLSDEAVAAVVKGASGLLFPSLAEGYGLPPVEALSLGTRVLCNDLAVLREVLGVCATFAPVSDPDLWINMLKAWQTSAIEEHVRFQAPTWADHFQVVLTKK